jgi:RNA polymerase sigma-70 factor (ECF subfamily)
MPAYTRGGAARFPQTEPDLDADGARITSGEPDDASLLRAIQAGTQDAVGDLYDRYGGQAYGLAVRITGDATAAEDAVQEAFVSLWRQAPRFDPARGQVKSWLLTIVHHKAVDIVRRRSGRPERSLPDTPDAFVDEDAGPEQRAEQMIDAEAVREAVRHVPEEQRRTIEMAYYRGMTHVEIAEETGVPLGTVKSRLRIGLEKMREFLRPRVLE